MERNLELLDILSEMILRSGKTHKEIGKQLFPFLNPDSARKRVSSSLSKDERKNSENFTFIEVIQICKICNSYEPLYYMCDQLGHERPKQITDLEKLKELRDKLPLLAEVFRTSLEAINEMLSKK